MHIRINEFVNLPISNVGLDSSQHVDGGLVELDQNGIVKLSQSEELEDLSDLRGQIVDTN